MTQSSVSEARWGILRSALLGEECSGDNKEASIHRFAGWNLLKKKRAAPLDQSVEFSCHDAHAILARQCLFGDKESMSVTCSVLMSDAEIKKLREQLGRQGILAKHPDEHRVMEVKWSYCPHVGMEYSLDDSTTLFARERKPRRRVTVRELLSHDLHQGVDNTGQTCVWDSESTLTHCLLNKESGLYKSLPILSQLSSKHNVIELGVGMVGIAGLALAKVAPVNVLLTDGHPDAVENNNINIRMNTLLGNVLCERLLWSTDIQVHQEEADLLLCSDCTHFQEHHAGLLITLGNLLKIGGTAILCQPPRAKSLDRFLNICDSISRLWEVKVVSEPSLELLHQESLRDSSYDPNLHCPCIVLLTKVRGLRAEDRQLARELQERRV